MLCVEILSIIRYIQAKIHTTEGWYHKVTVRTKGIVGKKDRLWITPVTKTKMHSMKDVKKFLEFMTTANGNEEEALVLFKAYKINRKK